MASETERAEPGPLPSSKANAIGRRQKARYYIDGRIVRAPDSTTVVLRLHDVRGDSVVARAGASGPAAAAIPRLGLEAVAGLLPPLLEPGRQVDLSALAQRRPTAIAEFLQGEHDYRRVSFSSALDHYRRAVKEDSSLAIAALKGARRRPTGGSRTRRRSSWWRSSRTHATGSPRGIRALPRASATTSLAPATAVAEYRRAIDLDPCGAGLGGTGRGVLPPAPGGECTRLSGGSGFLRAPPDRLQLCSPAPASLGDRAPPGRHHRGAPDDLRLSAG